MGVLGGSRRRLGRGRFYELLIAPLTTRERYVLGVIILLFIVAIIVPLVEADISDVGTKIRIPSSVCSSSNNDWSQPQLATGHPSVQNTDPIGLIDKSNSAYGYGSPSPLECSGFTNTADSRRTLAVELSLSVKDMEDQSNASEVEQTGGSEPSRIDSRPNPIPANSVDSSKPNLDQIIRISISDDANNSWSQLHILNSEILNSTNSHLAIRLPDSINPDLSKLSFRVEPIVASNQPYAIYIENLSLTYEIAPEQSIDLLFVDQTLQTNQPVLPVDKPVKFKLKSKLSNENYLSGLAKKIDSSIGAPPSEPKITLNSSIFNHSSQKRTPLNSSLQWRDFAIDGSAEWDFEFNLGRSADPGLYTLEIEITTAGGTRQTLTQDFLWGVLAMNPDKSVYATNETANFGFGVLNELGEVVCDAELILEITTPLSSQTISTSTGEIQVTDSCRLLGGQDQADYVSSILLEENGTYSLNLTAKTANGLYSISDQLFVEESPQYSITRSGPTRIYPAVDYAMTISVSSRDGFEGIINEFVPASFIVNQAVFINELTQTNLDESTKQLSWAVNIAPGQEILLGYSFDAPNISPEFYTLGPLKIGQDYEEQRAWMIASDATGQMILLYDGGTIPSGWTCVSCISGDPFYQRLIRGAATYGTTGGASTHNHSATGVVNATGAAASIESRAGTSIADNSHTHSYTPTISSSSNLPSYRQLKVIRSDVGDEPASLPAGVIALFDASVPSGWTRYSAHDSYYTYSEGTAGTTGGSNTHTHTISGNVSASSSTSPSASRGGGSQTSGATEGHIHSVSSTSSPANHQPPYINVVLGKKDSAGAPPVGMISMWNNTDIPTSWSIVSNASDPFYQRFFVGSSSYGTTGGSSTNSHNDTTGITSSGPVGTTNGRTGTSGASSSHAHNVSVTNYSSDNHLPPYIEAVFAKKDSSENRQQVAYRWYDNADSTDVGSTRATQDTAMTSPEQGTPFRLRLLMHAGGSNIATNGFTGNLRYSVKSGTCDSDFIGETYVNVGTTGAISFYNNSTPVDNSALTTNANDPTHTTDTIQAQTYEESNTFSNSQSAINTGQDGLWDFSLIDNSAPENTSYCFIIVNQDGSPIETYSSIAELVTPDQPGRLTLFYDGASAPAGWTCVSCNAGDPYYQKFIRGEASYGSSSGSSSHIHSATAVVAASADAAVSRNTSGSDIASSTHTHSLSPTIAPASNLPLYRQLLIIRADVTGEPGSLPTGAIAMFDTTPPSGWTAYSAQNGYYVYGEGTASTTGGSNSHTHGITGTTGSITSTQYRQLGGGTQVSAATAGHNHTISGTSNSQSNEPPYRDVILAKLDSSASVPDNMIGIWDDVIPLDWTSVSGSGEAFYQQFIKSAASYGGTGGSATNNHTDDVIATGAPDAFVSSRSGTGGANNTHLHNATISYVAANHLPPYIDVILAKKGSNVAPNNPASLSQEKTDSTSLSVGDWTDETSVVFKASASDTNNPDDLQLCVEIVTLATSFTNTETSCGTAVTYSGSAVNVSVTIAGLVTGSQYHWQARIKDSAGLYSSWVSFGANAENARDVGVDTTDPSGTVYDGTTAGVDVDYNNGSLSQLSANWNITDGDSGINQYEYSIGTAPGGTNIKTWTNVALATSTTATSLTLNTSQPYYFNIRSTDNAGNVVVISSDGQVVSPTLSFSTAPGAVSFVNLNSSNNYTDAKSATLTTSTNAYNGYEIRAYITGLLTNQSGDTIAVFDGGTYGSPDEWLGPDTGYGYTSNDSLVQGSNLFGSTPCAGGGNPPCYAPFSLSAPGDIVADHTSTVSGSPILNETFILTHRVTVDPSQQAGIYSGIVIYSVSARY